jgi:sec-independent protein translocase protein TatC
MMLIFAFGLAFQLPIVLGLLGKFGVVTAKQLAKFRKWAIVIILAVAALLAPPDVLSQCALAIPLYCLYEISIGLVKWLETSNAEDQHAGPGTYP